MKRFLFLFYFLSISLNQDVILTLDCPDQVLSGSDDNLFYFQFEILEPNIISDLSLHLLITPNENIEIDINSYVFNDPFFNEIFLPPCVIIDDGMNCPFDPIMGNFIILSSGTYTISYSFSAIDENSEVIFSFEDVYFGDLYNNILEVDYSNSCIIQIINDDCNLGDLNNDENIDILDIVQLVNIIISFEEPTDNELCYGDMNNDGTIDILDIVQLVNIIIN